MFQLQKSQLWAWGFQKFNVSEFFGTVSEQACLLEEVSELFHDCRKMVQFKLGKLVDSISEHYCFGTVSSDRPDVESSQKEGK